jgi:O-antigen/teichoic acid export membrane protein
LLNSSLRLNIVANFIGRFWTSLIGIIFVPIYIHFIGIEAYGLLGVFATVQAVLGLFDMGLSTTLNRELAKFNALAGHKQYMNNLVFTMEVFYVSISLLAGLALIIVSWFFAAHWIKTDKLDETTVVTSFILMAINFAVQFPGSLYQGGLMGLQKQLSLNVIISGIATVKAIGAIFILWFISPTIIAFLYWQIFLSAVQFLVLRTYLWKALPLPESKPRFDKVVIRQSGRYAAGIMGIAVLSIILTQSDKIILSKLVTLTEFGYYALAATITTSLAMVLYPITGAVFPRITELISKKKETVYLELFHRASQLISLIIMPLGISLFIFAEPIILAWTRNPEIARHAGPILQFLVLGTTINSLMTIPYQYTLAVGWLRFGININLVAIVFFVPAIFYAVYTHGAIGGAFVWMVLNICYLVFAMIYLFSKELKTERSKWYVADIARPLLICTVFAVPFFLIHQYYHLTGFKGLLLFGSCLLVCFSVTLWLGTPGLKPEVIRIINKVRGSKTVAL